MDVSPFHHIIRFDDIKLYNNLSFYFALLATQKKMWWQDIKCVTSSKLHYVTLKKFKIIFHWDANTKIFPNIYFIRQITHFSYKSLIDNWYTFNKIISKVIKYYCSFSNIQLICKLLYINMFCKGSVADLAHNIMENDKY